MAKRSKHKKGSPQALSPKPASPPKPIEARKSLPAKSRTISWHLAWPAIAIAVAVFWIYWPALRGDWLWDDDRYITDNFLLRTLSGLGTIWLQPGSAYDYYPVEATVQWVQWHLWGLDTLGYHLTNVVLHIASALLVWRLLSKFHLKLAWLGGLLFAVHPVQVESVAWIAELKNTLSLPLLLGAMCLYLGYDENRRLRDYWLALVLFVIALLCKLSVVLLPLVILLHAWWKRGRIGWNDLKAGGPFFAAALAVGLVTILGGVWDHQFNHLQPGYAPVGGIFGRLALAGQAFSFYFSKVFLPVGLLPVYPLWPVDYASPLSYLPWLVFGGAFFWCWKHRRGWGRHALLGLGFFAINLGPCPGFIPTPNMGYAWVMDHFLYLPIIGLIGLVIAAMEQLDARVPTLHLAGVGITAIMMLLLTWQSHDYASRFINEETLWTYTLQYNSQAWPAYNNRGVAEARTGQVPEAIEQFEQALKIKPDYAEAHNNLGDALLQTGRVSEAMEQFEESLKINPDFAAAHCNLGVALGKTGRAAEAMEQFEQAIKIAPGYAEAHNNLGNALVEAGRAPEAIEQFTAALKSDPDYTEARGNLGSALLQADRVPEAIEQYDQILNVKPDNAETHVNLGIALARTDRVPEAMEQFEQALKINPDYAEAHYNLGFALLQTGRTTEAIDHFEQALRLKPNYIEAHSNLGIALFQIGRASEAAEQFEKVLILNPNDANARDNLAKIQALEKAGPAKK